MTDPIAQMESYRDALEAVGVRCALDPRDVNPPAVLIRPPVLNYRFGRGVIGSAWTAWLFIPDAGTLDALRIAFPILDKVQGAMATVGVAILTATPAEFQPADGGLVPGFVLNWNTTQ